MGYILFLIGMTILCALFIIFLINPLVKYQRIVNICFILTIFVLHIISMIRLYFADGFNDWNFQNSLPTANVSPFMFTFIIFALVLPKRINQYLLLLISLLIVGMFLSPTFSCIFNAARSYKFHWHFLLDYLAHYLLFLFGIYIIRSKQVELNVKNSLISSSIIIVVAIIMMILNIIFDTSFFGLSLNGKHNIYNMVLVSNSYLSALLYFIGLIAVLVAGYFVEILLNQNKQKTSI